MNGWKQGELTPYASAIFTKAFYPKDGKIWFKQINKFNNSRVVIVPELKKSKVRYLTMDMANLFFVPVGAEVNSFVCETLDSFLKPIDRESF